MWQLLLLLLIGKTVVVVGFCWLGLTRNSTAKLSPVEPIEPSSGRGCRRCSGRDGGG